MSDLDLKAIRGRALALRNMIPGHDDGEDPYVVHAYELEDGDDCRAIELDEHDSDHFPLESRVYVADHCLMAVVPTCEGALMHGTAEAIACIGADAIALIARVEELEAKLANAEERVGFGCEEPGCGDTCPGCMAAAEHDAEVTR